MKRVFIRAFLLVYLLFLASCANQESRRGTEIVEGAKKELWNCLKDSRKYKSVCALDLHSNLSLLSNDHYGKLPALNMATSLYALFIGVERGKIDREEAKVQLLRIDDEFQRDLKFAQKISELERRSAAIQQQQFFMNAQKLLSNPAVTLHCYRSVMPYLVNCY